MVSKTKSWKYDFQFIEVIDLSSRHTLRLKTFLFAFYCGQQEAVWTMLWRYALFQYPTLYSDINYNRINTIQESLQVKVRWYTSEIIEFQIYLAQNKHRIAVMLIFFFCLSHSYNLQFFYLLEPSKNNLYNILSCLEMKVNFVDKNSNK